MGLLDSVIGSVFGQTSTPNGGTSGMSPLVKALLLMLAAKAASSYMSRGDAPATPAPGGVPAGASGSIESGILKGMPDLDTLLGKLKGAGLGDSVQSWIGHGPNAPLPPNQLEGALGADTVDQLARETNLPRDQLMAQLSSALPQVIDKLTPDGTLPAPTDRGHW